MTIKTTQTTGKFVVDIDISIVEHDHVDSVGSSVKVSARGTSKANALANLQRVLQTTIRNLQSIDVENI